MSIDTIFYAIIAVVLLVRLWSVLGRRNDDEKQRPNPFVTPAPDLKDSQKNDPKAIRSAVVDTIADAYIALRPTHAAPASLTGGLEQIRTLDPSFDEKVFLQGARAAFTMIVEDFAKGDMNRIGRLLGPGVLPHFQNAIEARRKAGQTMESRIVRIRDAETVTARTEDARAVITIRFVSEQENTLRDASGQVINGEAGKVEEITDLWTFARDTKSGDPNWILTETRA